MKRVLASLFILHFSFFISACSLPANPPPIVKIGLVAPFEGLGRPYGYAVLAAMKLAVADANTSGELGTYKAALVALNDDGWARGADAQARAAAQDPDIMTVLGPWDAATAQAAAPVFAANRLPAMVVASLETLPEGVAAACPQPAGLATQMATQAARVGTGAMGVDGPDNDLARALHSTGYGQAGSASTWLYAGDAAQAADDLVAAAAEDRRPLLVGGPDVLRPWLPQRAGGSAEGARAPACVLAGALPLDFAARYQAAAGTPPGPEARLAYAGARVLLRAVSADIQLHRRPTRGGVTAALQSLPLQTSLEWFQLQNGKWMHVPPSQ